MTVDALAAAAYSGEFCVAPSFEPTFVAGLMRAGFLAMSMKIDIPVLLPKLHVSRAVLDPAATKAARSVSRLLTRFELRPNADFDLILDSCIAIHGEDWLTPELCRCFREISRSDLGVRMLAFGLYKEDRLVAGEFGVVCGAAYTSYSGFRTVSSSGTVQLLLTGRFLEAAGFVLWDLGMPMDYKVRLGARTVPMRDFIGMFRAARSKNLVSLRP